MNRYKTKYTNLFKEYNNLDWQQTALLNGAIFPPDSIRQKYEELQVKKIAILEEMDKVYEKKQIPI